MSTYIGIDLAGVEKNPTGIAIVSSLQLTTCIVRRDCEILEIVSRYRPRVVAIDAPLTSPTSGYTRFVDRLMHKLGYPVLPPLFPGMRKLTERATKLVSRILTVAPDSKVIEVHPRSTEKILLINSIEKLITYLEKLGISIRELPKSKHEYDATLAVLTAILYDLGLAVPVGDDEGRIVLPKKVAKRIVSEA